jgi:hypothetical protein
MIIFIVLHFSWIRSYSLLILDYICDLLSIENSRFGQITVWVIIRATARVAPTLHHTRVGE